MHALLQNQVMVLTNCMKLGDLCGRAILQICMLTMHNPHYPDLGHAGIIHNCYTILNHGLFAP